MNEIKETVKAAKEVAELSKKGDAYDRDIKRYAEYLNKDSEKGRDTALNASKLKYASIEKAKIEKQKQKALDQLK